MWGISSWPVGDSTKRSDHVMFASQELGERMNTRFLAAARAAAAGAVLLVLAGCAGQQAKRNAELDVALEAGSYRDAALIAESRMDLEPPAVEGDLPEITYQPKQVIAHLEAGEAWRLAGDTERAVQHFDAAESALGDTDENVGGRAAGKVGAALVNETLATYVPSPAEAVLINYYKALIFWGNGEADLARVELNRADDRTRRAVERYTKEIEKAQGEAAKGKNPNQTYDNPEVAGNINSHFPEMAQWAPYAEFVVPPATYLQALFLANSDVPSDMEKANELYQRLGGIVGEHQALTQDRGSLEAGDICPEDDCIWVMVERSRGPQLVERKFSYPVFTGSSLVQVQMALPALAPRFDPVFQDCLIKYEGIDQACDPFASMERVIQTEFQKRFPGIVTRSVVSAAAKAIAQDQVAQNAGLFGGLLAAVITDSITTADVRMWRSLPGDFTLNRLRRNGSSELQLHVGSQQLQLVLDKPGSQLVHVTALMPHLPPVVTIVSI